jgi:hypothetical protein
MLAQPVYGKVRHCRSVIATGRRFRLAKAQSLELGSSSLSEILEIPVAAE